MKCARCGVETPRLTISQRRCPPCEAQVQALVAADERRRAPRFGIPKDMTTLTGVVL